MKILKSWLAACIDSNKFFLGALTQGPRLVCVTALVWIFATEAMGATAIPLASGLSEVTAIAVDGNYVYWAEVNGSTALLRRVLNSGGPTENLITFAAFRDPFGIYRGINRIAFTATKLYFGWGSYDGDRIEEATKTGTSRRVVVPNYTGGNFLGVINGYVYYLQGFCCITKVPIDGSAGPQTVLTGNWVRSAAYDSGAIYFVEYFSRNVYRFDVATNTRTPLITGNAVEGGVVIDANNVYYSDGSRIRVVSKLGGSVSTLYTGTNVSVRVSDGGILYFTEGGNLKAIPATGGSATLILPGASVVGMVQDPNALYWADASAGANAGIVNSLLKAPGIVQNQPVAQRSPTPFIDFLVSLGTTKICKRSAVVIVHGWNSDPDQWASALGNQIIDKINVAKKAGMIPQCEQWNVELYDWKVRAGERVPNQVLNGKNACIGLTEGSLFGIDTTKLPCFAPSQAFANAYAEGYNLGNILASQQRDHIHFIAHSAGSNLIQTAFEVLMSSSLPKRPATVQMTFLDAYFPIVPDIGNLLDLSLDEIFRTSQIYKPLAFANSGYGVGATWAEQYVDNRDLSDGALANTNYAYPNTFTFDITNIDPDKNAHLVATHGWPHLWYRCAVDPKSPWTACPGGIAASKWGINLSLESGAASLPPWGANNNPCTLVTGSEPCNIVTSGSVSKRVMTRTQFQQLFIAQGNAIPSLTGTVAWEPTGVVKLVTGSPVWVSLPNATTENFDSIQFDYQFLSNAQGLLSVYIDDQVVYVAEEVDSSPGVHHSPLIPVGPVTPGLHSLSIRLDPQSANQSVAQVSNLLTGTATIVQVQNLAPLAVAVAPAIARQGSLVRLDGTASSDPDQFPRPLGYSWKQLIGPVAALSDGYAAAPTFVAVQAGQYGFSLTVTDGPSFTTSRQVSVVVPILGDIDSDGDVDNNDLARITSALNTKANGPNDLRDLDGDGMITALDARKLVTLCTRARCATQ